VKSQVVEVAQITFEEEVEDVEDGLSLLLVCDNPIAALAVLEVMRELSPETTQAVWGQLPQDKYQQLQHWAVELLIDGDRIVGDQLFDNGLTITQRVLTAFRVLPKELKQRVWASIPSSRQQELRNIAA
jgi:hypothetical protein